VRALALANYPLDVSATRTSRAANLQPVGRVPRYLWRHRVASWRRISRSEAPIRKAPAHGPRILPIQAWNSLD